MDLQNLIDILSRATELTDLSSPSIPAGAATNAPAGQFRCPQRPSPVPILSAVAFPKSCAPTGPRKPLPAKAGKSAIKPSLSSSAAAPGNAKKRTWKKPADKPKRPLSAYNLFFQSERAAIVEAKDREILLAEKAAGAGAASPLKNKSQSPGRSRGGKRAHRRTHGKIGFAALAQNIAAKWKELDSVTKAPFEKRALVEKARYRKEIEVWEAKRKAKKEQEDQQPRQEKPQEVKGQDGKKAQEATKPAAAAKSPAKKAPAAQKRKLPRQPAPSVAMTAGAAMMARAAAKKPQPQPQHSMASFEPLSLRSMLRPAAPQHHQMQQQYMQQMQMQPQHMMTAHQQQHMMASAVPSQVSSAAAPVMPHQVTPPLPRSSAVVVSPISAPKGAAAPLRHLDDFEMNIDAIFGSEGASLPAAESLSLDIPSAGGVEDVFGSLDRMSDDLDGEFLDFMGAFDEDHALVR